MSYCDLKVVVFGQTRHILYANYLLGLVYELLVQLLHKSRGILGKFFESFLVAFTQILAETALYWMYFMLNLMG